MKANYLPAILLAALAFAACQKKTAPTNTKDYLNEPKEDFDRRMAWWREARFGLFIHWGLYAVPAGEWNGVDTYGEWIRTTAEIPLETYDQFVGQFNPVKFNAADWARMAKDAGMKYIVITSKHHDGFGIFDSKHTDFDVTSTPFKRDILKELAGACKAEGIRLCFYHSIMDWHHPDYLPRRDWEKTRSAEGADYERFVGYLKNQLQELCTNYGEAPHVLWFDGEWESTWTHERGADLYNYVRNLKPDIIINNRVDVGREGMAGNTRKGFTGDFGTPEQEIPATGLPGADWESCMTMNGNWGYNKADKNFKSTKELLQNLSDIASKGGNFLLNVGPTGEGLFPQESIERLAQMGDWMKKNGEAVHGTQASPFSKLDWNGRCTWKPSGANTNLYLHVFEAPKSGKLVLPGVANEPVGAQWLAAPGKVLLKVERRETDLVVDLGGRELPDPINSVIVLVLKGKPDIHGAPALKLAHDIFVGETAVPLEDPAGNAEIRYTLDGSAPTSQSALYAEPFLIKNTTTISARSFRDGKPISAVFQKKLAKVEPQPATPVLAAAPGLQYLYFEGDWEKLPDFDKMKSVKTGSVKNFDLSPRRDKQHSGFEFRGFLDVPADGVYTFYCASDDGSRLWLDNKLVVDNDGLHGWNEEQGVAALAKGKHDIRVRYFNRTGGDGLAVSWKTGAGEQLPIPDGALFHVQPK